MPYFTPDERAACVSALRARLTPHDLKELVPDDFIPLVWGAGGLDHDERANLVTDYYGPEMLRERKVREALLKRATDEEVDELLNYGAPPPVRGRAGAEREVVGRKWSPGKGWARHFVQTLAFPLVLVGVPDGGTAPDFEEVEPYVPMPELHDFQQSLLKKLTRVLSAEADHNRGILSLPTGAGKTRTVVEAIVSHMAGNGQSHESTLILWIAQSEELCEQAIEAFRQVWIDHSVRMAQREQSSRLSPLRLSRLWGTREVPEVSQTGIVVASIQKLENLCDQPDARLLELIDAIRIVVVDEAHHAIAPSYTRVFQALGLGSRTTNGKRPMVGLTATPYRGSEAESIRLISRFQGNLMVPGWKDPIGKLRESGVLSRMVPQSVDTKRQFELNSQELQQLQLLHELPKSVLLRIGRDRIRNKHILERLLELPEDWPVLFFACSVPHAHAMAVLLRRAGRTAASVTGQTPRSLRRTYIEEFRLGSLQFLANYGVLTTGFDAPQVRVVAIARPTGSVLLYEQMVGRGMRGPANGGTEECLILDFVDRIASFGDQMSYTRYEDLWTRRPRR